MMQILDDIYHLLAENIYRKGIILLYIGLNISLYRMGQEGLLNNH